MYVCERACRYNGAAPRSSLPGRQNSGTWKYLSAPAIQMETDCNISLCTFHPGWGEGCKHHEQIFLSCDAWRMAQLLGEPWLISAWQVRFQSRSDWLVPPHPSFNPSSVHRTCFLPSRTLIPVSRWEDVEHLPLAFLSISVWRLGGLWVPWAAAFPENSPALSSRRQG